MPVHSRPWHTPWRRLSACAHSLKGCATFASPHPAVSPLAGPEAVALGEQDEGGERQEKGEHAVAECHDGVAMQGNVSEPSVDHSERPKKENRSEHLAPLLAAECCEMLA
jgi:hypothetical protein